MKAAGRKSVCVVAWDYQMARIADRAGVDIVSVGDTVGVNLWGHANPLEITLDEMLVVAKAVRRGVTSGAGQLRLPVRSAAGGRRQRRPRGDRDSSRRPASTWSSSTARADFPEAVEAVTRAGIPVFAQFGITPQTALRYGVAVQRDAVDGRAGAGRA